MKNFFKASALLIGMCAAFSGCGTGVTVIALVQGPSISGVSPQVVTAGTPSVTVTVQGANFSANSALTVNGTVVPTSFVSASTLAAQISGTTLAQPNVAQLQVTNKNGGQSNQVPLTVASAPTSAQTLSIASPSLPGAQVGTAYSGKFSATGGTPGYTWAVTSGSLPAGMTLTSAGVLSGTPTLAGTSTFVLSVTDSGSPAQQRSVTLSLVVSAVAQTPAALVTNAVTLGVAKVGSAYAAALSATGGTPGYTWTLASGSLPGGLALSSAGVLSGTPTAAGTATFTATVSDSGSPVQTATVQETITVSATASNLSITAGGLGAGKTGTGYSATLSATGGTPGYMWAVLSGSLPTGLTLSPGGVISGTPITSGTSTFTVGVQDGGTPVETASVQESITVSATAAPLSITTGALGAGKTGTGYSATLSATGGTPGYTWAVTSGSLPAGLALSVNGVISGTPTVNGTSTFTVEVLDNGSPVETASVQESITVATTVAPLSITTSTLAAGKTGTGYTAWLSATGGTSGYTWTVTSGSLPAGLTLSTGGVISGTPTAAGTSTFTVGVQDSGSPVQTAAMQESMAVAAPPALTIAAGALAAGKTGGNYSATLSATGGTPGYTWTVTSGSLPAGLTLSTGGVIWGTPTSGGSSTFTVGVQDNGAPVQTTSAQESITISTAPLTITTTKLGAGQSGGAYSAVLGASGGTPGYTWTVTSGSLPAGLTLSPGGVISGTPTAAGSATFTVSASDSGTTVQSASVPETITVNPAATSATPGSAQLYVFPQAPVATIGSYQTVTAIVTGVNDKTVTWSTDGGTIVGTNPCVVNEPCTIGLYSTAAGTYHMTATSNANSAVVATSTITFSPSPIPRTDHPRFMITSDMLTELRAKAIPSNVPYQAIKNIANQYYTPDSSNWTFSAWNGSACTGGSGPSSDQTANYREIDAYWMSIVSLLDSSASTRNQYGCAAHDVFMTNIGYVLNGQLDLTKGNRWADTAIDFSFAADWLMGGGYLSASDQTAVRAFLAKLAYEQINNIYNGTLAVIGNYNSPAQFQETNDLSTTSMRAMGNNYTHARILILTAAALTFNDNPTDDPPLTNTCNATRYQVCPDGTAGSLHAYWTYVSGGMLYKDWADMEDGNVVQSAYNAAFNNLASQPQCNTLWHTAMPCLGMSRGGESSEGTFYGQHIEKLRSALNAIHTAGYDDPILYGPQMSMDTMSFWDLKYVADLSLLTGMSGFSTQKSAWTFLTDGDTLNYFTYPSLYGVESGMLTADSYVGRTDRTADLEWLVMNTAFGTANGQAGACTSYCGFDSELSDDYASGVALDLFLSLPAGDPEANLPADPRASLPTDWFSAGNQHIIVRDGGWTTGANTIFNYYCTNTQIDHEHEYCGRFDLYSNGEYITKGRMEFNDYNNEMSASRNQNLPTFINNPTQTGCTYSNGCFAADSTMLGGQLWHGYQAGLNTLYHAELPGYAASLADSKNGYNGGWGAFGQLNGITGASRSLIYLRNSDVVIYYDRGDSGSAWDKANYLVTTGQPSFSGNTASWLTRSGNQKAYWTSLEPAGSAPSLDTQYTDADAANDWEIYGRIKVDAGAVPSARFLSVLQWGPATSSAMAAVDVSSTSGTSFEGALVGSTLVMFMHDWPTAFTSVTYPASGATTQYVSDLAPHTAYAIVGAGTPATVTTDSAGVLTFSAAGTGSITISPSGS